MNGQETHVIAAGFENLENKNQKDMEMAYKLLKMTEKDREGVIEVYNYFILNSMAAYRGKKVALDYFDNFLYTARNYLALTVRGEGGEVVGFAMLNPYHSAESFNKTATITYFVMPEYTGKGIGGAILNIFIKWARKRKISNILANVSSLNTQSLKFHQKNGFVKCGLLQGIGRKFGQDFNVVWMQKKI